jgi:hypothetical protein
MSRQGLAPAAVAPSKTSRRLSMAAVENPSIPPRKPAIGPLLQNQVSKPPFALDSAISTQTLAITSFPAQSRLLPSNPAHSKIKCQLTAGAKILGNIEVGQCARVAAGSVVLKNVPRNTTVAGVPAKVVGEAGCEQPSHQMDQIVAGSE